MWIIFIIGIALVGLALWLLINSSSRNRKNRKYLRGNQKLPLWHRAQIVLWVIILFIGFSLVLGAYYMI